MPKKVDHDQRRRHIVEALWRVVLDEGLAAVSFRRVAAEADVSVRRIQYYFGTKAELLRHALQLVGEEVFARGAGAMAALGPDPSPRDQLWALLLAGLPVDDESRRTSLLFFSFHVAAITDVALTSPEALEAPGWVVPFAADLLRAAEADGLTRPGVDPDSDALILMSAFFGVCLFVLAGTQTIEGAKAAIGHQLDRLFLGEP